MVIRIRGRWLCWQSSRCVRTPVCVRLDWEGRQCVVGCTTQIQISEKTCAGSIGSSLRVILVRVCSELEGPCDLPPTNDESWIINGWTPVNTEWILSQERMTENVCSLWSCQALVGYGGFVWVVFVPSRKGLGVRA